MKDGKFETQVEIWRHLLSGGKVKYKDDDIVGLVDGVVFNFFRCETSAPASWGFCYPDEWSIYEEPKPKKKVTLYRYTYEYQGNVVQSTFISKEWGGYKSHGDKLLLTESKEVEYDDV